MARLGMHIRYRAVFARILKYWPILYSFKTPYIKKVELATIANASASEAWLRGFNLRG